MAHALNRHVMVGSMGRVGAAGDNAVMESFWSLRQPGVLNQRRWPTSQELLLAIVVWIERKYHQQRPQDSLGRLTPSSTKTTSPLAQRPLPGPNLSPVLASRPFRGVGRVELGSAVPLPRSTEIGHRDLPLWYPQEPPLASRWGIGANCPRRPSCRPGGCRSPVAHRFRRLARCRRRSPRSPQPWRRRSSCRRARTRSCG
jgi:hypothetical protein